MISDKSLEIAIRAMENSRSWAHNAGKPEIKEALSELRAELESRKAREKAANELLDGLNSAGKLTDFSPRPKDWEVEKVEQGEKNKPAIALLEEFKKDPCTEKDCPTCAMLNDSVLGEKWVHAREEGDLFDSACYFETEEEAKESGLHAIKVVISRARG
jgi:hypothetical protein